MNCRLLLFNLFCLGIMLPLTLQAQDRFRVMEWNVENLFDYEHDSLKNDYEFLPTSVRRWDRFRYWDKLSKIAKGIVSVHDVYVPDLVALCEVENERTLVDLTRYSPLKNVGYRFVMTDSPDQRGIDVAMLYQPGSFRLLTYRSIRIASEQIDRAPTRDILHVTGRVITGDTLDVFVCHMPSRSGGRKESEPYRLFTASVLKAQADSVMSVRQHPHVLVTGDFNDYPTNKSLIEILDTHQPEAVPLPNRLYSLMKPKKGEGTYCYQGEWGILDHIIVSGRLLAKENIFHVIDNRARIIKLPFLLTEDARYGDSIPYRTYWGARYQGGYSDHLPILAEFAITRDDTVRHAR